MRKYNSFKEYLWDKYYNDIFRAVKKFVNDNCGDLGFYGKIGPDDVRLDDFKIRSVVFHQMAGNRIRFNATVQADIILRGHRRRDSESNIVEKWFSVQLSGIMRDGLNSVSIGSVDNYSREDYKKS